MLGLFTQRRADRQAAERIYASAVAGARRSELFTEFGIPDTSEGRFESVVLHLFPILHRLMHDPGDDPKLARLVAESLVSHLDATLRETGVGDTSVPKRMRGIYGAFAGRIDAYEKAFGESEGAFVDAIGRNVLPSTDAAAANALARYIRESVMAMRSATLAELRSGRLPFPDLAGFFSGEGAHE